MLATGRYSQWQSHFMRYVDTKPNGDALRKFILEGPYKLSTVTILGKPTTNDSPAVEEQTVLETLSNISPENKAHYDAKKKFTSRDGETIESYYSRFVTVVKKTVDLDKESYHKLFDIMKQYQKEVDEICAEKIARNANPLALILKKAVIQNKLREIRICRKTWTMTVAEARETVVEKGVPLQAEQADWLEDTDEEVNEQELEAHYMYMAKIQEVHTTDSGPSFDADPLEEVHTNNDYNVFANERQHSEQPVSIHSTCVVEKVDSNVIPDSSDMCDNENQADQNAEECEDERVMLANLIANLKLDTDENKKIQKQLKKANISLSYELQKF
ncbi:hypothetical protein Tco_0417123 [Tanacetum coccineum]